MNDNDYERFEDTRYERFARDFERQNTDRQARRKRRARKPGQPAPRAHEIRDALADTEGLESGFQPTYRPSHYESGWLLQSLEEFYNQAVITDVLALIKGGKEASVYRCAAHPSTGTAFVAAKVYRPRRYRSLSNDKLYREGRDLLTTAGRRLDQTDHRLMRAVHRRSAFGEQVTHTSWLMHEYVTLQQLYGAGAPVPRPYAVSENAIIMTYYGDEQMAAPLLSDVRLDRDEAEPLFQAVLATVERLLASGMVHGDLSAYNVLYWQGDVAVIDFPQVVDWQHNPSAYAILERDLTRLGEYFTRQGFDVHAGSLTQRLWEQYVGTPPDEQAVRQMRLLLDDGTM